MQTTDSDHSPSTSEQHPVQFNGTAGEFFPIWLTNICLSIITLGIYSAWAKVRTNQYFYGNTQLAGASFQYLADPIAILKGRIIAFIALATIVVLNQFSPAIGALFMALVALLLPWIIVRSLAFRMRNTAYRNIRFDFIGSTRSIMLLYYIPATPLILMFVLGAMGNESAAGIVYGVFVLAALIGFPAWLYMLHLFIINNTCYGQSQFGYGAKPSNYYKIYFTVFMATLGIGIVVGILAAIFGGVFAGISAAAGSMDTANQASTAGFAIGAIVMVLVYLAMGVAFRALFDSLLINLQYNQSRIEHVGFESSLTFMGLFKLYTINAIVLMLTLGLAMPWVKVRTARYRADCLVVNSEQALDSFVGKQDGSVSALGEELGEMFDFDLGVG